MSKNLTHMMGLIRMAFWYFPSYELAKHPCIKKVVEFIVTGHSTHQFRFVVLEIWRNASSYHPSSRD